MPEVSLSARDVSVVRGAKTIVSRVQLDVAAGEVLAVLGPNGAGKSTLLRALAGLSPYSGTVQLGGVDAARLSPRERARRLAFVPQQTALRSALPVTEVVAQGRYAHRGGLGRETAADRRAVAHALELADAAGFAARSFTTLSLGEQRRVLIARALATGAKTLCLDEPTASLDVHHVLRLHALLRRLAAEGYAIVAVLHPLDDALRHADRALLLAGGRVVCSGNAREVIHAGVVRDVYQVEMQHDRALGFALSGSEVP